MATMTLPRVVNLKDAILEALANREYGPAELLLYVEQHTNFSDDEIKDAVSELLDDRRIQLSPDRKLRLRSAETAA